MIWRSTLASARSPARRTRTDGSARRQTTEPNRCRDHTAIAEEAIIASHAVPRIQLVAWIRRSKFANRHCVSWRPHMGCSGYIGGGGHSSGTSRARRCVNPRYVEFRSIDGRMARSLHARMQAEKLRRHPQGREAKPPSNRHALTFPRRVWENHLGVQKRKHNVSTAKNQSSCSIETIERSRPWFGINCLAIGKAISKPKKMASEEIESQRGILSAIDVLTSFIGIFLRNNQPTTPEAAIISTWPSANCSSARAAIAAPTAIAPLSLSGAIPTMLRMASVIFPEVFSRRLSHRRS